MKFSDGFWQMRPGVTPHYAVQVHEIEVDAGSMTVHAATKKLASRGDMLDGPMLSIRYSSPLENVIRVQAVHFKGGTPPSPEFKLKDAQYQAVITQDEYSATLTSGQLSVQVHQGEEWRVMYHGGEHQLTASSGRSLGIVDTPEGRFIHEQLDLGVGECVYGLGERFTALVKNGQVVDMWNADGGTSSEEAYKNIPFYLTNRGYGVFVNHPERVSIEVAAEKVERVQFSVPGERLEYFIIYGPTPKQVLERYTALTGRPALPPAWSFGLWLSTSFTTDYDEATVTGFIGEMKRRGIPLSVFHFDCFWMKEFLWSDFTWDQRCFPDPAGMLQRLKANGLHICVWINPYIAQRSALFDKALAGGYLLKRPDGSAWQTDQWQPGMGIVDFTNPEARRWFQDQLRPLLEMGVDAFKSDFGERIPTDVTWFDGSDPQRMHNYYSFLYNQAVFELLCEVRGEGEAVVFARSATTGGQQFPVHWGGDSTASFASMAESLRGGLSLGLSGFGFWSHDIGGFEQTSVAEVYKNKASAALYKRWCAFGLLSSHSRLHGNSSYRVPWNYDEEAVQVLAKFTRLKCSLMPYLLAAACEAHEQGIPMLRAMLLEFPEDPACEGLDRQYMLGESLLVAPVFSPDPAAKDAAVQDAAVQGGSVDYYVPAGRWTSLLDGSVVEGPRWVRQQHGFLSLPLLVRPGAVIPIGEHSDRPDYNYASGVTLLAYELTQGVKTVRIPTTTGETDATFTLQRSGDHLEVARTGPAKPWRLLLVGVRSVASVEGGKAELSPSGLLVTPDEAGGGVSVVGLT